jgi:hypothetical protein
VNTQATAQAVPGIEAVELTDQAAEETLVTDFGALSLEPMEEDEFSKRLRRAGFAVGQSQRSAGRADAKGQQ